MNEWENAVPLDAHIFHLTRKTLSCSALAITETWHLKGCMLKLSTFPACLPSLNWLHSNSTHFSPFSWQYYAISCQTCCYLIFLSPFYVYKKSEKEWVTSHTFHYLLCTCDRFLLCDILKVLCSLTKNSK